VLENTHRPPRGAAPADFRVVAIMPTYNEEDVIAHSLRYLVDQGIQVYLIDNWSTDATLERARPFLGRGLVDAERFPAAGPSRTYDLRNLLTRVEEVSETLDADWFMLYDADERRRSPWLGLSLKDALHYVDRCGFNCVDHLTVNFWPVDDRFDPARDVERQLTHFELSDHPGHFHQRRVWKNLGRRVSLAPTAGHDVGFEGRLVYPFKFLLKHYPIRSQAHGERKILAERKPRWNAEERSLGWHAQYDALETMGSFLRDPAELTQADDETFHQQYLVERLSGIGVFRDPPFWVTPPR
jgi:glycosyltransferase involved in cell wall biosynthesis